MCLTMKKIDKIKLVGPLELKTNLHGLSFWLISQDKKVYATSLCSAFLRIFRTFAIDSGVG